MSWKSDVRVVVGIDFGTTYSGFAYRFTDFAEEIHTNKDWEGYVGKYKTNTVLEYDDNFENAVKWGRPAFIKGTTNEADDTNEPKSVGLFKLHLGSLGKLQDHLKPKIPVEFKKAIIDYLREMGKLIKKTVEKVEGIKFHENVLLVLSVPAEYSKKELAIMRECVFEADLIKEENSEYLQFTTEPEAAAIYCMKNCLESHEIGTTFMIVDCGGGTVDLTTRKLVGENQLGEITERAGDYCGSSFIDEVFLKHIGSIVGNSTIDKLRDKKSKSLQRMIDHFCRKAKFPFTGEDTDFQYDLDVLDVIKVLKKFVNDEAKELLEKNGWSIEIEFEEIKSMFDPIVEKIIQMIGTQLDNCRDECSIIFLVGGFGQSKYLKNRIEDKFKDRVKSIVVSKEPVAAVVRGATLFGLSLYDKIYNMRNDEDVVFVLKNRKLNFTYGIKVFKPFRNDDPPERKTSNGFIQRFHRIAKRDDIVDIDSEIRIYNLCPVSGFQTFATFYIYITKEYDPKYCDGMEVLGTLKIDLSNNETDRRVSFALSFGQMELLTATARNETNGQNYLATFEINKEIGIV